MTHHIRQQFLEVELTGTEAEGLEIQRHLSELYYQKLLPALEKVFDQSSSEDHVLKIDRLEIDAGSIAIDQLDSEFPDAILKKLARAIQEARDNELTHSDKINKESDSKNDIRKNLLDVFIWFLKTGSLPWSFRLPADRTLEEVVAGIIESLRSEAESINFSGRIKEVLTNPETVKRLVNQFSYSFQTSFLRLLSDEIAKIAERINSSVHNASLTTEVKAEFRQNLFESAFSYASYAVNPNEAGLITELVKKLPVRIASLTEIAGITKAGRPEPGKKLTDSKPDGKDTISSEPLDEKDVYYIDNAGLVLLHPFLDRYFKALGIIQDNEMIQPYRALSLLHYLVTGQTTAPEYELVLPKILCGLPLLAPINGEKEINDNESEESMALLTAVILHWTALRNTGPDSLRGTFLLRPGKLTLSEDGNWLLLVESRTVDVLLNHLPWGISMIKLPWMDGMLKVEWVY